MLVVCINSVRKLINLIKFEIWNGSLGVGAYLGVLNLYSIVDVDGTSLQLYKNNVMLHLLFIYDFIAHFTFIISVCYDDVRKY